MLRRDGQQGPRSVLAVGGIILRTAPHVQTEFSARVRYTPAMLAMPAVCGKLVGRWLTTASDHEDARRQWGAGR